MMLDTLLFALVALAVWEWPLWGVGSYSAFFLFITGAFFSSNLEKVPKGAWFPLVVSAVLSLMTFLWREWLPVCCTSARSRRAWGGVAG